MRSNPISHQEMIMAKTISKSGKKKVAISDRFQNHRTSLPLALSPLIPPLFHLPPPVHPSKPPKHSNHSLSHPPKPPSSACLRTETLLSSTPSRWPDSTCCSNQLRLTHPYIRKTTLIFCGINQCNISCNTKKLKKMKRKKEEREENDIQTYSQ